MDFKVPLNTYVKMLSEHPDVVLIHRGGRVTFVNDQILYLLGYQPGEIIGNNVGDFLSAESKNKISGSAGARMILNGEVIELEAVCKGGRNKHISVRSSVINYNNKKSVLSTISDISEKKNFESILKYSENKFSALFDALNESVFIIEIETGVIIDANLKAQRMLRASKKEIVGMHYSKLHPREEFDDYIKKFEFGANLPDQIFKNILVSSGERVEVEISASVVELVPGVTVFQGIYRDITDRKKSDEQLKNSLREKEVLLKEVHHRVKNNLQIISSLFGMQLKNIKNVEYSNLVKDALGRIKSIALIHEKLYRAGSFSKINFSEYIREIITYISRYYFNESCVVNFHYAIENISLDLDRSISLSLIVNELVTNSLKYAFCDVSEGDIFVSFNKTCEGEYVLRVSDGGRGFKTPPDMAFPSTFGLGLVCDLVREIGGSIKLINGRGASYEINFKDKKL
ncbi:MAG: putative sensor histidine kinase pdtaS [bacterium ADurb.Bin243]|nr:MAG: putative sensor histidine kinase pdtaS [bacterium ADurb.Bin243]HOD39133.1 PAS domain S-box protein [Candidatus Wallbacteria bacterium]